MEATFAGYRGKHVLDEALTVDMVVCCELATNVETPSYSASYLLRTSLRPLHYLCTNSEMGMSGHFSLHVLEQAARRIMCEYS